MTDQAPDNSSPPSPPDVNDPRLPAGITNGKPGNSRKPKPPTAAAVPDDESEAPPETAAAARPQQPPLQTLTDEQRLAEAKKFWMSLEVWPPLNQGLEPRLKAEFDHILLHPPGSKTALADYGHSILAHGNLEPDEKAIILMVAAAKERGWTEISFTGGSNEFKDKVWLEARRQGIKVNGYEQPAFVAQLAESIGQQLAANDKSFAKLGDDKKQAKVQQHLTPAIHDQQSKWDQNAQQMLSAPVPPPPPAAAAEAKPAAPPVMPPAAVPPGVVAALKAGTAMSSRLHEILKQENHGALVRNSINMSLSKAPVDCSDPKLGFALWVMAKAAGRDVADIYEPKELKGLTNEQKAQATQMAVGAWRRFAESRRGNLQKLNAPQTPSAPDLQNKATAPTP